MEKKKTHFDYTRVNHYSKKQKAKKKGDLPVEESGNVLRRVLQKSLLQQEFNALFRIHIELLPSERKLFSSGCIFTAIK